MKILVSSVWGGRSRWDVDNRGEITVLKVFDMQNSNCSQSSGARCSTEKQLHINIYIFFINKLHMNIINTRKSRSLHDLLSSCSESLLLFSLGWIQVKLTWPLVHDIVIIFVSPLVPLCVRVFCCVATSRSFLPLSLFFPPQSAV